MGKDHSGCSRESLGMHERESYEETASEIVERGSQMMMRFFDTVGDKLSVRECRGYEAPRCFLGDKVRFGRDDQGIGALEQSGTCKKKKLGKMIIYLNHDTKFHHFNKIIGIILQIENFNHNQY